MEEKEELSVLSHEITYRRYLMNRDKMKEIFEKLSAAEYIALHIIASESEASAIYEGKTYLKDLSDRMEISMRQTSKMIGALRDKGLLRWVHDGNGCEGTYVTITESGRKLLEEQEILLRKYYGRVITKFGKDNMIKLLQLMKELDTIMSSELEEPEGTEEEPLLSLPNSKEDEYE